MPSAVTLISDAHALQKTHVIIATIGRFHAGLFATTGREPTGDDSTPGPQVGTMLTDESRPRRPYKGRDHA